MGGDAGQPFARAGIDYYYYGNGFYVRKPDGTYLKMLGQGDPSGETLVPYNGFPRFTVLCTISPFPIWGVYAYVNGAITLLPGLDNQKLFYKPTRFRTNGVGDKTIVSFPSAFATHDVATTLQLTRVVDESISGTLMDYPVKGVGVSDGVNEEVHNTIYVFKPETAVFDESGYTTQYHEVTTIPGSYSVNDKSNGYIITYFNNGLTANELGIPYVPFDKSWLGASYKTEMYNVDNVMVSSSVTDFTTFSKDINNDAGTYIQTVKYVRPTRSTVMQDGVQIITDNQYDDRTGLVWQSIAYDHNSKGNQVTTNYKYFWEQYDPARSTNILSPVIQTKKTITTPLSGQVVTDVTATTWKSWNNVFGPHKKYQWKRTGSSTDFDFANWSGAGEPAADWLKMSQVDAMDATGNIIQVTNR